MDKRVSERLRSVLIKPLPYRWMLILGGVLLLLSLTSCLIGLPPEVFAAFEVLFTLVFGSGGFIARVTPQIHVRWDLVASTLVYAIALIIGSHLFLRWLYREMSKSRAPADSPVTTSWGVALTLRGFAIIVLMFLVGMAAIGVAHQTAWLITGPERIFTRPSDTRRERDCAANLTQIHAALLAYANKHDGRFPDDFGTLISETGYPPEILICRASNDMLAKGETPAETAKLLGQPGHCSYLYFGKGLTATAPGNTVLVTEPLENHRRGINVLYADNSVVWLEADEAETLLARLQQPTPATQPATRP